MQKLEFIYKLGSQEPIKTWEKLESILGRHECIDSVFLYGKKVKALKIPKELKRLSAEAFNIESAKFKFHFSTVTNYRHVVLQIENKSDCEGAWWEVWVSELIKLDGFVQAWVVDSEFNYWQNAADPIEYESRGKSYTGLPMKSNGLPPPLEQLEIDISKNPGLRKLREGYVEAIGGHMWLSETFLDLVNKNVEDIRNVANVSIEYITPYIVHLWSQTGLFKDSTSQLEQIQLREALYLSSVPSG